MKPCIRRKTFKHHILSTVYISTVNSSLQLLHLKMQIKFNFYYFNAIKIGKKHSVRTAQWNTIWTSQRFQLNHRKCWSWFWFLHNMIRHALFVGYTQQNKWHIRCLFRIPTKALWQQVDVSFFWKPRQTLSHAKCANFQKETYTVTACWSKSALNVSFILLCVICIN